MKCISCRRNFNPSAYCEECKPADGVRQAPLGPIDYREDIYRRIADRVIDDLDYPEHVRVGLFHMWKAGIDAAHGIERGWDDAN